MTLEEYELDMSIEEHNEIYRQQSLRDKKKGEQMIFKDYKVGDKVWNITRGWETIIEIDKKHNDEYPIETNCGSYREDGREYKNDLIPTIYPKPVPELEIDTKVLVWYNDERTKTKRHFAKFDSNGKIMTYPEGCSSFTRILHLPLETWDNYEKYGETDNEG